MRRALVVAALLAAAPASAVAATFSAPFALSDVHDLGSAPVLAVAPTGAAVAMFSLADGAEGETGSLQIALRPAGGTFGTSTEIAGGGAASVAMDGAGDATVVWTASLGGHSVVRVATAPAGEGLGPAATISDPTRDALAPTAADDAAGDAVVAWDYSVPGNPNAGTAVSSAARSGLGAFGPEQVLATVPVSVGAPSVAMDAHGDAVIVYELDESQSSYRLMMSRRDAGGTASTPTALTAPGAHAEHEDVGITANGIGTISYQVLAGACSQGCTETTRAITLSTAGKVTADQALATGSPTGAPTRVAVDAGGDVAVAWLDGAGRADVKLATEQAGGSFDRPFTLGVADSFALAGDGNGDRLVTWPAVTGTSTVLRYVQSTGANGPFSTPADIPGSDPFAVTAALTAPGNAVLGWLDHAGGKAQVKAATTGAAAVTPTPTPSHTPPPYFTSHPDSALAVQLKRAKRRQTRRGVLSRGHLVVRCFGARVCRVTVRYRGRVVARGHGAGRVAAALTPHGRRALRRHRRLTLRVVAKATRAGTTASDRLQLRLR